MITVGVVIAACLLAGLWLVPPPVHTLPESSGAECGRFHQTRVRPWRLLRRWRARSRRGDPRDDAALIGGALTSVAARLRAGQHPGLAWEAVAVTLPIDLVHVVKGLAAPNRLVKAPSTPALAAALAATRLAHGLGAELAPVLEAAAEGIEEAARAQGEREAALAGPRATARLLLALPVLGLAVGTFIGARPWELLTTSIWGGLLFVTAAGFALAGRTWIARLVASAELEGGGWGS